MIGCCYSYQQWLRKNRPGKLAEGLTPLSELSDLTKYALCGELEVDADSGHGRCPGSNKRLAGPGPFQIADGKLWHPSHTACPECVSQGLASSEAPRLYSDGSLWCTRHYAVQCDAQNCRVCHEPLQFNESQTLVNGDVICYKHQSEPRCYCCGRVTGAQAGRSIVLCSMCAQDTVWDQETANVLFSEVSANTYYTESG